MKVLFQFSLFLLSSTITAQNLVKNPSFEESTKCPNALGTFSNDVKDWSTPTGGTTDYFNECSAIMGIPENFNGEQQPIDGKAYAGLYFYAPADYREYIQSELKYTLKKGIEYQLSFYASLAEGSDFAVKDFGIVFSDKAFALKTKEELSKGKLFKSKLRFQQFEVGHDEFHEDKSSWFQVNLTFTAAGYEKYFFLGNLRDNHTTRKVQTTRKQTKKGAYYYIDEVSLTKISAVDGQRSELKKDSLYVFKDVHFDFNEYTLDAAARAELSLISERLIADSKMYLEIHAHTDDLGSNNYNLTLSKARAEAIAAYFINLGIAKDRILCYAHGSTKPLMQNISEVARSVNRRAEFVLVSY